MIVHFEETLAEWNMLPFENTATHYVFKVDKFLLRNVDTQVDEKVYACAPKFCLQASQGSNKLFCSVIYGSPKKEVNRVFE